MKHITFFNLYTVFVIVCTAQAVTAFSGNPPFFMILIDIDFICWLYVFAKEFKR